MTYARPYAAGLAARPRPIGLPGQTPANPMQARSRAPMRSYDVSCLAQNGEIRDIRQMAPALPVFENAFSALARGTLIATADGPVAVEDLLPGTYVQTVDNGLQPLLWVGSINLVPGAGPNPEMAQLSRIAADSFGLGRPMPDLMTGPAARLIHRHPTCQTMLGTEAVLAPVNAFQDGESVIRITPAAPVRVYHLAFARHQIIRANGLEVESYHPGLRSEVPMNGDLLALFLSLFPHVRDLQDFGPLAYPRISSETVMNLQAA